MKRTPKMGQKSSSHAVAAEEVNSLKTFADERLEEEIALVNLRFEQKKAARLAERREQFAWELMAAGTMTAILFFAGSVYKRKDLVIPIAPLIMGVGYRYDAAYGTQSNVLRESAEKLLREDGHRFQPAGGPLTIAQVDAFRQQL